MSFFEKHLKKLGKKGFSLVELVCAMAILGIIGTAISGALMISANAFDSGKNETRVQEEAQLVANQISDFLLDATAEVSYEGNILKVKQGDVEYYIEYNSAEQKLYYSSTRTGTVKQLMAENLTTFLVDVSQYATNGNVMLKMKFINNDREYSANYTVTSRNKEVSGASVAVASITIPSEVILIPRETYTFVPTVSGVSNTELNWEVLNSSSASGGTTINNGVLTIGNDEQSQLVKVHVKTVELIAGNPAAEAFVNVYVRRVYSIDGVLTKPDGCQYKAGDEFFIDMNSIVVGNAEDTGLPTEYENYKDPRMVRLSAGASTSGHSDFVLNHNVFSMGGTDTRAVFKLTADMEYGESYTITATALHPTGENKTNREGMMVTYSPVTKTFTIFCDTEDGTGDWTIPVGGWLRIADQQQGSMNQTLYMNKKELLQSHTEGHGPEGNIYGHAMTSFYEFRYKPYGTDDSNFTPWILNSTGDGNDGAVFNLRPNTTGLMDYDKKYVIEIRVTFWDQQCNNQFWPIVGVTPKSQYQIGSTMEKVSVSFYSKALGIDFGAPDGNGLCSHGGVTGSGREEADIHTISLNDLNGVQLLQFTHQSPEDIASGINSPKQVEEWWPEHISYLVLPNKVEGIPSDRIANEMQFIIEKKTDEGWKVCEKGVDFQDIQTDQGSCKVTKNNNTTTGLYRIKIWAKDMNYSILYNDPTNGLVPKSSLSAAEAAAGSVDSANGTFTYDGKVYPCIVAGDGSVTFKRNYELYDEYDGTGIYYFTITD